MDTNEGYCRTCGKAVKPDADDRLCYYCDLVRKTNDSSSRETRSSRRSKLLPNMDGSDGSETLSSGKTSGNITDTVADNKVSRISELFVHVQIFFSQRHPLLLSTDH